MAAVLGSATLSASSSVTARLTSTEYVYVVGYRRGQKVLVNNREFTVRTIRLDKGIATYFSDRGVGVSAADIQHPAPGEFAYVARFKPNQFLHNDRFNSNLVVRRVSLSIGRLVRFVYTDTLNRRHEEEDLVVGE